MWFVFEYCMLSESLLDNLTPISVNNCDMYRKDTPVGYYLNKNYFTSEKQMFACWNIIWKCLSVNIKQLTYFILNNLIYRLFLETIGLQCWNGYLLAYTTAICEGALWTLNIAFCLYKKWYLSVLIETNLGIYKNANGKKSSMTMNFPLRESKWIEF